MYNQVETKIERLIDTKQSKLLVPVKELGRVKRLEDGNSRYIEILKSNFPNDFNLKGIKIIIDCANGAGYKAAPKILEELGAEVIGLPHTPMGGDATGTSGISLYFRI